MRRITVLISILLGTLVLNSSVHAESMQVLGGNSMAMECYRLSTVATMTGHSSSADVRVCNQAIRHANLRKRDLIATYINRGILYVAQEDYKRAAKDYNRALGMSDNVAEAYVNRGNLWFMAQRYTEAIADYDKSLELEIGQSHVAYLNKGMAYEILGKFELARENYLAALAKVEEWPIALEKLDRVNKKIP